MTQLLLDAGADPNTTLSAPAEDKFLEYVQQKFLRHYLSEEDGMTLLMEPDRVGDSIGITAMSWNSSTAKLERP